MAGAADYHLGGFRALPKDKFKIQQSNPYVTSTRCHMLALGKGDYKVTLYKDVRDTDTNPNHLIKDTLTVTAKDKITVPLASDGGAAMHILSLIHI